MRKKYDARICSGLGRYLGLNNNYCSMIKFRALLFLVLALLSVQAFAAADFRFVGVNPGGSRGAEGGWSDWEGTYAAGCAALPNSYFVSEAPSGCRWQGIGGLQANVERASSTTCPNGYGANGDACNPPPAPTDPDIAACNAASVISNSTLGVSYEEVTLTGQISSGTSVCVPTVGTSSPTTIGCTMNFNLDIGYEAPSGIKVSRGTVDTQGSYVTLPCSLTTTDPVKPKKATITVCPPGEQMGQINGVDSCQKYGPGTKSTSVDSTGTKTESDGPHVTKTETNCVGTSCTTTVTNTNTSTNAVSVTTSTVTKGEFCENNKSSPQCGGSSAAGAPDGKCAEGDQTLACAKLGEVPEAGVLENTNTPVTFAKDTGWGPSTASCPAPRTLNLSFMTVAVPFTLLCDFATGIRPFVIGMAYLGAAFTFFGFVNRK